jgi:PKD repeat protein
MKLYIPSMAKLKLVFSPVFCGIVIFYSTLASAGDYKYPDSWGKSGYTVESQTGSRILINYSVQEFALTDVMINDENCQNLELIGHFLPNDAGAPGLPGSGRYIGIPQGAEAKMSIISYRQEILNNINLAPAFRIPLDTEKGPLDYTKNESVYSSDSFFPSVPVVLSPKDLIRGIDVVMLGITPFQYNPVTKQLIVYRDLKIEITFNGGNGHFGDDRLRSRWWDPMLSDMILNYETLPKINYDKAIQPTDETGCEYLIITPNNTEFQQWADTIRKFRATQGILTKVVTIDEVGGNGATIIESYIDNAYNNWDIAPVACLLLGDYGTNGSNSIISPMWNSYCVSDNIYADVNGNGLPDIVFARITAQDEIQLQVMVSKFVNYENSPPTSEYFYDHPITSLGWQSDSWSQICSEVIGGYWQVVQGKSPVRINEIYSGTPGSEWSTALNTGTVVNYFGPSPVGLGYIPEQPSELGGWSGGTAEMINNAINTGSFMVQHRDHGFENGWGEPDYSSMSINNLLNTDLTFVWSVNSLTGKFNYSSEVFAERFHRYTHKDENSGCFGINAASEVTYSFVSDVYVWGAYDNMWPDFMPDYGSTPEPRGVLPAFACAAGKYFLEQSNWPSNSESKEATYHLFHHHGDAFTTVYSEVPQYLTVAHNSIMYMGETSFDVSADVGALIALSVNGELMGTATGTGSPVTIEIPAQAPPDKVLVTVTKQNYYRYESLVDVLPATGPYVVYNSVSLNDESGNGNGQMETSETILTAITVENVGVEDATNIVVTLTTTNPYITITDPSENYGIIPAGTTAVVADGFAWNVANNIPDMQVVLFEVSATDGTLTWTSTFSLTGHAPLIESGIILTDDYQGNFNGRLDPSETAYLIIPTYNNGSYYAASTLGTLTCSSSYVTVNNTTFNFYDIGAGMMEEAMFNVTVSANAPAGTYVDFLYQVTSGGYSHQEVYPTIISMIVEDWETGDMSMFDWTTGGNSNWALSTQSPYQGSFCIKSGILESAQNNHLSIEYEVFGADSLSFWYKVSSEAGYDFLTFYIDDVVTDSWSGEIDWTRVSFIVTTGIHTFKWEYSKDESLSSGEDCCWVDFIVFPVAVYEAAFGSNETEICAGESVSFYDQSPANTVSWDWVFEGGTPGTSTLQNPVVEYQSSGIYDVSLTVSNGSENNTLLLENYITVTTIPQIAPTPTGPEMVCATTEYSIYNTTGLSGITVYEWLLDPVTAGSITGLGVNATVSWTIGFLGDATLKVAGENNCGTGSFSNPINITRYLPEVTLEPFNWICVGWPAIELTGGSPAGGEYSGPGVDNGIFDPAVAGVGTHTITYTYSDAISCENYATETILVDPCTGITANSDLSEITIYPNPAKGMITIEMDHNPEKAVVLVMNTLNQVVYSSSMVNLTSDKWNFDLSSLPKGIYFIRLKTNNKEVTQKLILE